MKNKGRAAFWLTVYGVIAVCATVVAVDYILGKAVTP